MDTATWKLDAEDRFILQAPAEDAELRIDTYDFVTSAHWREMLASTRLRAKHGVRIEEIECGQFAGVTYEHPDDDGKYCREWLLGYADLALFVTLICGHDAAPKYQEAANGMLSTLVECRA